jgi:S-adenosyl-L-methionine hydrolase (adenosine-forming)
MIVLFTDFGLNGPYVGQMKAVLHRIAPGVAVVDLLHDAPAFDPRLSAYLLAAYAPEFPEGSVFVCVVDPGVGSARRALVVAAGGHLYVGPDNGLLHAVVDRAGIDATRAWEIGWRPERLSDSFHGRDLFAPVAARLAMSASVEAEEIEATSVEPASVCRAGWPSDLAEIVCIDPYGNLISGIRAAGLDREVVVEASGRRIAYARTFSEVLIGAAFWHHNSNGLVEIAVNQAPAAEVLGLGLGAEIRLDRSGGNVA